MSENLPRCLIDDSVTTALISYPLRAGWVEEAAGLDLVPGLRATQLRIGQDCALIDSMEATTIADRYAVITDVALVSRFTGAVALWTPKRPDEIDGVTVALDDVSLTAEALARATLRRHFGITATAWDRARSESEAVIQEGTVVLQEVADGHREDLVRAWSILSGLPVPTHLLIVPRRLVEADPDAVAALVSAFERLRDVGLARRRELRRNLTDELELDRDRLAAFQADQRLSLSGDARDGWLDLARRPSRALNLPPVRQPLLVSIDEGSGD